MGKQMRLEVTSCCGGVAALCANKRLLSRVGEHVSLEDTSCCAGVVALFAKEKASLHCEPSCAFSDDQL